MADQTTIPWKREDVLCYLDNCIERWRAIRRTQSTMQEMATHYIDAFQSVRMSLFGEELP